MKYTCYTFWVMNFLMFQMLRADNVECFSWEQKLKALEFNARASEEKITSIRQQLVELEENEKGIVDQLASASNDFNQTGKELHGIRTSVKSVRARLFAAESAATDAQVNLTIFSNIQSEAGRFLRTLKESTEHLSSSRNSVDDRIHKYELKLNMLKTDVNASIKTLNDSRETLFRHTSKEQKMRKAMIQATRAMQQSLNHINAVYSEEHVIGSQLDRLRAEIADETGLLENRKSELESHEHLLSEAHQKLDDERTDLETQRHAYGLYLNGTLLELIKRVKGLEQDGGKLVKNLDMIVVDESSRSDFSSTDSQSLSDGDDLSPDNLRKLMRDTRIFLSKHGYRESISFMEENPIGLYNDIDFIRNKSKQLTVVRELSGVDEALTEADSRLDHGLTRLKIMGRDIKSVREKTSEEQSIIRQLNGTVLALMSDVSRIQGMLNASNSLFKNETETDKSFRDSIAVKESKIRDATGASNRLNQSLVAQTARVREASHDLLERENDLSGLYQAINITQRAISTMNAETVKADMILQEAYTTIASLQTEYDSSRSSSENQQRMHMELVADISELSRRLSELIRNIADVESTRDKISRDISSLRQQANTLLTQRLSITENLEEELKVRQEFLDKKKGIEDTLNRMVCGKRN